VTQVKIGNVDQVFVKKVFVSAGRKMIAAMFMKIVILVYIADQLKIGLFKVYAQI